MEFQYLLSLPSGWASDSCEQDFCKGAKASKSLECGSSTPPSSIFSEHEDEWTGFQDSLEAFCDVILPQTQQFGPEDLFEDLINDGATFTTEHYIASPSQIKPNDCRNPPLTIKLKKVKCTKSPFPPAVSGYPSLANVNFECPNASPNDSLTSDVDDLTNESLGSDFALELDGASPATSACLTLKDAFELENPDLILDSYLSSDGAESPTQVNGIDEKDISSDESFVAWEACGDLSVPTFSDYSSSASSPCYSEDHQCTALPLTEYQKESSSGKTKSKRSRKGNYKLTAESRYLRKKEQNKQAALRYRAKKKQEDEQLLKTLKEEEDRKEKLEKKLSSVQQEASILRKLLKEMLIAKNSFHSS